jgi:hypothetical protein
LKYRVARALHRGTAIMDVYDWQVMVPASVALATVVLSLLVAARRGVVGVPVALALGLWLTLTFELARAGVFLRFETVPPRVMVAAMVALASMLAFARSESGRRLVAAVPLAAIAALQAFRVPVEVALHALYTRGAIPVQMTWSGRNVDVFVGLTAPLVAYAFHRAWIGRRAFAAWHVASLAALVNIVATAAMSFPGPTRVFHEGVAATVVATAPFIWLPALLVPVAAASHALSLRALLRSA